MNASQTLSTKRVLIYRLGSLGDTVVALPSLHLVARAFPNAERRMLTNLPVSAKAPAAAAVLGESGLVNGYFHYKVGTRSALELASLWWQLVRWRPQVVVYLAAFRGAETVIRDTRFFTFCGIRRKIGFPLTEALQQNEPQEGREAFEPETKRLARNLAELGDARLDDWASWELRLTAGEIEAASVALEPAAGMQLIAVSIGTKVQANDWGAANWQALASALPAVATVQGPPYALVFCGAADEFATCEAVADCWRRNGGGVALNLCGRLTPRQSAAVYARARVFIGHDSGPMHLAAAVQTTCVAIFSARKKPRIWFPYGSQHRVIYHKVECSGCGLDTCIIERKRCILSVAVDEVLAEVRGVLGCL